MNTNKNQNDIPEMLNYRNKLQDEYENLLLKYPPDSLEAVHWINKKKVWLRFKILTQIGDLSGKKILDFGCGNSLLINYLQEKGISCEYEGWDISPHMIEVSKRIHPVEKFLTCNVLNDDLNGYNDYFDFILINGVFNLKSGDKDEVHTKWMQKILLKLWPLCNKGIAVDFMTEYVDWKEPNLYYSSLQDITNFCAKNLSRWFVLKQL